MYKQFVFLILLIPSIAMSQSYVGTSDTKIKSIDTYNEFGGGDIFFKVENSVPECASGYWFTKSDAGFNANLSIVLSAYQAKNTVVVYGLPSLPWSGSGGPVCKLYSLELR